MIGCGANAPWTEDSFASATRCLLLCPNIRPFAGAAIERAADIIVGPTLGPVWQAIAGAAKAGDCLHICGESGTGKELAARHLHRSSGRLSRPFTAVNCATIPPPLAERLLFGARKGAYSGADADADGYVQTAQGGTLFLDEVADLDLPVQAKLLRMLEERQILPLGATKVVAVDVRVCSATHRDLAAEVARGRFRDDLYYRLGLLHRGPALRERREEIPWLMQSMAGQDADPLRLHASVVEETLLRPWPGNVRELGKRMAEAARTARAQGETSIRAIHLSPLAGRLNAPAPASAGSAASSAGSASSASSGSRMPDTPSRILDAPLSRPQVERALADAGGNVTATAVALGLHRTQLRRLMVQLGIRRPKSPGDGED